MNFSGPFFQSRAFSFHNFDVCHFPVTRGNDHPVAGFIDKVLVMTTQPDRRVVWKIDLRDGRIKLFISVAGFTTDFYGLKLFGINISVAHDIKLRMAVNAFETKFEMDVLSDLSMAGKYKLFVHAALWEIIFADGFCEEISMALQAA